jgi:lipid-A-disaccharide synthase-like uncharacterized protein
MFFKVQALAAILMIVVGVIGVIIIVSGHIRTGLIVFILGVGTGLIISIINEVRLLRKLRKRIQR